MSRAATLEGAAVNLALLREDAKVELLNILDETSAGSQNTCLVLDPSLSGPLNLVVVEGAKVLKAHGVKDFKELNWSELNTACEDIVYLVRPGIKAMKQIAAHMRDSGIVNSSSSSSSRRKKRAPSAKKVSIYFVPRRSFLSIQVLKDEGVYDALEGRIHEYNLGLIPFDNDVVSMELDWGFRESHLDGDQTCVSHVAQALLDAEELYGNFRHVQAKGSMSKMILDHMKTIKVQSAAETDVDERQRSGSLGMMAPLRPPEIDTLILLDRDVDLITPMCTPLTYEALIDELIGITNTYVSVETESDRSSSPVGGGSDRGPKPQKTLIPLNSNDALFAEIRNFNIAVLMKFLNDRAKRLRGLREDVHNAQEVKELKAFVKKIPQLQQAMKDLSHHIDIMHKLLSTTNESSFRDRWHAERSILEGDSCYDYIEDCIARNESLLKVLRLLCLQSLVSNGFSSKRYDYFRREMQHTYGYEVLFTLDNLERVGLFKRQKTSGNWSSVRKSFKLIKDDVSPSEPDDIAYVTSGYAPLSVRVVQLAIRPGWNRGHDMLKLLSGTPMVQYHFRGDGAPSSTDAPPDAPGSMDLSMGNGGRRKTMMVFYTGGVTYAEIAALRFVSRQDACPYNIIVAATKIINGDSFLKSLLHEFKTR